MNYLFNCRSDEKSDIAIRQKQVTKISECVTGSEISTIVL